MFSKRQAQFLQPFKYTTLVVYFIFAIFCAKVDLVAGRVPVNEFLPFEERDGATITYIRNSDIYQVRLGFPFHYYGQKYTSVYIQDDGILRFIKDKRWHLSSCPVSVGYEIPSCMALFTDLDPTTERTSVSYVVSSDNALLSRVSSDISQLSLPFRNLSLTNLFAATWKNISHDSAKAARNTFQAILTTDGINSFVLFYYNKVQIPLDRSAFSGLTDSAKNLYHLLGTHCHNNITALVHNSNINMPGKWVFSVYSCVNANGKTDLMHKEKILNTTFHASTLGQGVLSIPLNSSDCIPLYDFAFVNCSFGNHSTEGKLLTAQGHTIICPIPMFSSPGLLSLVVRVTLVHGFTSVTRSFSAKVIVVRSEDSVSDAVYLSTQVSKLGNVILHANWNPQRLEFGNDIPCCDIKTRATSIHILKLQELQGWLDLGNITDGFENSGGFNGTMDWAVNLNEVNTSKLAVVVQHIWKLSNWFVLRKQVVVNRYQADAFFEIVRITNKHNNIVHSPRQIPVFGNVPLFFKLPYLTNIPLNVKCNFIEANKNVQSTNGVILSEEASLITCSVPFLSSVGTVKVQLQLDYNTYPSQVFFDTFYASREEDCDPGNFSQIQIVDFNSEDYVLLQVSLDSAWKSHFFVPGISNHVNASHASSQIVFYHYTENAWEEIFVSNSIVINGSANVTLELEELLEIFERGYQFAVGIKETFKTDVGHKFSGVTFQTMKDAFWLIDSLKKVAGLKEPFDFILKCAFWSEEEEVSIKHTSACPKTVKQARRDWRFIENDGKHTLEINDENAFSFTQALSSGTGQGKQCLYDYDENLSNYSHVQRYCSTNRINYWEYYWNDAVPFTICCERGSPSNNPYLSKRAIGSSYSIPRFALALSTGKIFPFDRYASSYTERLSSVGEFWAIRYAEKSVIAGKSVHFDMQIRVEQYLTADGTLKDVPTITAVAILDRCHNRDFGLQIYRNKNALCVQINNKEPYQLGIVPGNENGQIFYFERTSIQYKSSSKVLATFMSGFSVLVTTAGNDEMGINVIVSASKERLGVGARYNTYGLLSEQAMETELVSAKETIFAYPFDKSYSTYYRPNVTLNVSAILGGTTENQNNTIAEEFLLTGSQSVANATKDIFQYFAELTRLRKWLAEVADWQNNTKIQNV